MLRANILTNFAGFSPRKSLLREIYMLKTKSNEITDTHQAPCEAPETAEALRRSMWQAWLRSLLLFCGASVYVELCLHLCVYRSLDRRAVYLVLFGLLGGTVCALLTTHLPKIARQIVGVLLVAVQVLFAEVQLMYHAIFGNFMPISQVSMGGNVITNFDSQILYSIGKNIVPILLLLVPLIVTILCLALRKLRVLTVRLKWRQALATLGILLTLLLATMGIMYAGRNKSFSVYKTFTNVNTSTDSSYKSVGMLATTVQELRYMVFGSTGSVIITPSPLGTDTRRLYSSNSYNVIESIDFAKLAESADNIMCRTTDEYLAQVVPTRKNNYTGLLQDYNLITICAESFCPWFISEELTPTLYKLSHTGIIFENYYGTFQSVTTNGEYTMCMGLYRLYVDNKFQMSSNIVNSDYYAHVFGKASSGGTLEDTVVFTDITGIFNQASVLYMYRNGYIDPETPNTFGGKATAKVGEFVDVLYRISQRPETDNTALPPDYENETFNGSACPYYDAVCWAYQTGLLRQGDLHTAYDDDMDYQTACLLIYRYAVMSGIDTHVDQELLRQTMWKNPRLSGEVVKAMLWCDDRDITTRDSGLSELLAAYDTHISRYQMTSFLFYLCTYELNSRNEA